MLSVFEKEGVPTEHQIIALLSYPGFSYVEAEKVHLVPSKNEKSYEQSLDQIFLKEFHRTKTSC